eukprot:10097493-Lingulodinium_polyedra.AAC.1
MFQEVRGLQGAARTIAKRKTFSAKCDEAKLAACASEEMEWAKISQEMAGWRRLSAEAVAAADSGEATAT